jgi:acetyl esterase/lipase
VVENKVARWIPKGFVVVSANYRMLPKVRPVEQARDVARALAAAQAGAATWGGDKRKFILMGHSAGAHLVTLVATSLPVSSGIVSTPWLGTVSLDSAALDVVKVMQAKHARLYDRAFGDDPDYWRSASPFHALTDAGRPMLLVCSGQRNDSCPQARWFLARATALGMQASVLEWDFSHKELNQRLGEDPAYTAAVESFMAGLDESVARKLSIHAGEMQPRGSR